MKKLKRLVLKKEVITSLNDSEMLNVKGGCSRYDLFSCAIDMSIYPGYDCSPSPRQTQPPRCCDYGCCETIGC